MQTETQKVSFTDLINGDKPVLVDFFATWCGPCQSMTPILAELAKEVGDDATVIKIDVDKNPQVASHYKVMGVPTFVVFQNGEIKWRQSGMVPKGILKKAIFSDQ
jgi:thioredoxin 1